MKSTTLPVDIENSRNAIQAEKQNLDEEIQQYKTPAEVTLWGVTIRNLEKDLNRVRRGINKVIVIDSDNIAFLILQKCFLYVGLTPLFVHLATGLDAIDYLKANDTNDLIFIDPVLPDMKNCEILHALHELNIFVQSKVCLLTTFLGGLCGDLTNQYPFYKKFIKPFQQSYVAELVCGGHRPVAG